MMVMTIIKTRTLQDFEQVLALVWVLTFQEKTVLIQV